LTPDSGRQAEEAYVEAWTWIALAAALFVLAAFVLIPLVGTAASYAYYPGFLDHGEPSTMLIGWRVVHGLPAYPPFDAAERITNIYGPMAYLPGGLLMALFGPELWAAKAFPAAAAVAAAIVVAWSRRPDGWTWAAAALTLAVGFTLLHLPAPLWNRPDSLVAVAVAAAVLAMNAAESGKPEHAKSALIALLAGVAAGAKLHAALYFVPVALAHAHGRGTKTLALMGGVGLLTVLAPFALPPFSLADYLTWFPKVAGKEHNWNIFFKVLRYALFYMAPVLPFALARTWRGPVHGRRETVYLASFLACLGLTLLPASKPGAGIHYLYPFMPLAVDLVMRNARRLMTADRKLVVGAVGVLAAALFMVDTPIQQRFFRALHWEESRAIGGELRRIMAAYPGRTIEMGVGERVESYPKTFLRPLLVTAGHPYSFDAAIVTETVAMGIPLPRETVERVRACRTDLWLVPKGERPFAMTGYYATRVFDEEFRAAFVQAYEKAASFEVFDVWACRR
jgi:hypothetical protein